MNINSSLETRQSGERDVPHVLRDVILAWVGGEKQNKKSGKMPNNEKLSNGKMFSLSKLPSSAENVFSVATFRKLLATSADLRVINFV